jgi:hypothetical protein
MGIIERYAVHLERFPFNLADARRTGKLVSHAADLAIR